MIISKWIPVGPSKVSMGPALWLGPGAYPLWLLSAKKE